MIDHRTKVQPIVARGQQLIVAMESGMMQPMVANRDKEGFSRRLKEALADAGLADHPNLAKLIASWFGLSREAGRKWLSGESLPNTHRISTLAQKTGVRGEWLLTGTTPKWDEHKQKGEFMGVPGLEKGVRSAPIVGTAQLGPDGYWTALDYPPGAGDGYVDAPSPDPDAYALRVRGDSMFPAIRDGWLVICEPNRELVPGEYVMVYTVDGRCMVKELLFQKNGILHLMSIADGHGRITLHPHEIEKCHYVGGVFPPSKARL